MQELLRNAAATATANFLCSPSIPICGQQKCVYKEEEEGEKREE